VGWSRCHSTRGIEGVGAEPRAGAAAFADDLTPCAGADLGLGLDPRTTHATATATTVAPSAAAPNATTLDAFSRLSGPLPP
jgi:hypothetical protein